MGPTGSKLAKQQDAVPSDEWNRMKNASYSKAVTIAFVDKASVKSTRTVTDRHPVDPDPKGTPSKKKVNVATRSAATGSVTEMMLHLRISMPSHERSGWCTRMRG